MEENAREIVWIKAARKAFSKFPMAAQDRINIALRIAAVGQKSDIAKPMKGMGAGVFEIALAYRSDAFRTIYAVNIGDRLIVVHAFQKKSKSGIKTPRAEVDLVRDRISRLKRS